jgi:hypothetical protein
MTDLRAALHRVVHSSTCANCGLPIHDDTTSEDWETDADGDGSCNNRGRRHTPSPVDRAAALEALDAFEVGPDAWSDPEHPELSNCTVGGHHLTWKEMYERSERRCRS